MHTNHEKRPVSQGAQFSLPCSRTHVSAMMLKAEKLEPACPQEFHNLISLLFVFYGLEELLADAENLSKDQCNDKWKQTLGDEHTGKSSKARFRRMKESHDEANHRISSRQPRMAWSQSSASISISE